MIGIGAGGVGAVRGDGGWLRGAMALGAWLVLVACGGSLPSERADVVDPGEDARGRPMKRPDVVPAKVPPVDLSVSGFTNPMAAVYGPNTDLYYVLDGVPGRGGRARGARILRVQPNGELKEDVWLAPARVPAGARGLAVDGGDLLVAAGSAVHVFDLLQGASIRTVPVAGAAGLDWIAADADTVYVGGSLAGADGMEAMGRHGMFRCRQFNLEPRRFEPVMDWPAEDETVAGVVRGESAYVAVRSGWIVAVDGKDRRTEVLTTPDRGLLCGLVRQAANRWFVAAGWAGSPAAGSPAIGGSGGPWIRRFGLGGGLVEAVSAGDQGHGGGVVRCLGWDPRRGRLLVGLGGAAAPKTQASSGEIPAAAAYLRIVTPNVR